MIEERGYSFVATPGDAYLQSPDGHIIPISTKCGVYGIDGKEHDDSEALVGYVKSNKAKIDYRDLHDRLGHCSHKVLVDTLNNTYGLSVDR